MPVVLVSESGSNQAPKGQMFADDRLQESMSMTALQRKTHCITFCVVGAGMMFRKEPFFYGHDNYDQLVKIAKVCPPMLHQSSTLAPPPCTLAALEPLPKPYH